MLKLDHTAPEGVRVQWKMAGTPARPGKHATWASLTGQGQAQEGTVVAQQHEFTVEHNPKYGTEALEECRSFVQEHEWKLLGEAGRTVKTGDGKEELTVEMNATDRNGRKVTFRGLQRGAQSWLEIETEEGIELPAASIGAAICERLGWKLPVATGQTVAP